MLFHVPDQLLKAFAVVMTGALVLDIAKSALNRVRLRTVRADHFELVGWSLGLRDKATVRPCPHLDFYQQMLDEARQAIVSNTLEWCALAYGREKMAIVTLKQRVAL